MPTLLIVDDHPGVLQTLEFVLATETLHVALSTCGAAALEICRREIVNAALVDLHMPVMNGLALLHALKDRAAASGRPLPIWLMTAAPTAAALEQARQAGVEGVLKKPFDAPAFRETLLRRLGREPESVPLAPNLEGPREALLFAGSGPPPVG